MPTFRLFGERKLLLKWYGHVISQNDTVVFHPSGFTSWSTNGMVSTFFQNSKKSQIMIFGETQWGKGFKGIKAIFFSFHALFRIFQLRKQT